MARRLLVAGLVLAALAAPASASAWTTVQTTTGSSSWRSYYAQLPGGAYDARLVMRSPVRTRVDWYVVGSPGSELEDEKGRAAGTWRPRAGRHVLPLPAASGSDVYVTVGANRRPGPWVLRLQVWRGLEDSA